MELRDAIAVVTGGARRLGRATVVALARSGCHVVVNHHQSPEAAADTVREAQALGVRAEAFRADVRERDRAHALIDFAIATFGRLDLLVANAGVFRRTPMADVTSDDWDDMMRSNLDTLFYCAQRAAPHLRERRGAIVAFADVAAIRPWVDYIPYSIAKSCVVALVRDLARELAPQVRVNAIAPGPVLFPDGFDPALRQREIDRTLLRRAGTAQDIADAVLFLARSDYITGVVLPVDGGRLLYRREA
ncbi:MAG: SDR family oxidoreductase [Deltaproteobacteria bacterium]|nr:SDR family oxidoreductase [Deltaproteobacteria bacterium]MBI3389120.1 SDR family oxidoreductase [Deltaproteobacteria bacterium]